MTYQQLIDREFFRIGVPNFVELQQRLIALSQSCPESMELTISSSKNSAFVFVSHMVCGAMQYTAPTIELHKRHSVDQWREQLAMLRMVVLNPPVEKPAYTEILLEQLKAERLEVARLRNLIKLSGGQAL